VAWLLDLDGVIWLAGEAIPGAPDAVASLRAAGERVVFVTNNSSVRLADQEAALARIGIPAEGNVLTSAQAAARLLVSGQTALVCGGPGVVEALGHRGVDVVERGPADAVVVGFTEAFDYELLRRSHAAIRDGALLIGTNDDPTYPTPDGPIPGGGAILAAVATAAGQQPVVAGNPAPTPSWVTARPPTACSPAGSAPASCWC
jgi:glycerol 3-phosphatase-2